MFWCKLGIHTFYAVTADNEDQTYDVCRCGYWHAHGRKAPLIYRSETPSGFKYWHKR